MSRVIIGIHGLGNKPPAKVLEIWWKASIREGLKRVGKPVKLFNFKMAYWSDCFYDTPMNSAIRDVKSPYYIDEPYVRDNKIQDEERPSDLRKKILLNLEAGMEKLFLNQDLTVNYSSINDFIIHHFFSDFEKYYKADCIQSSEGNQRARDIIDARLADLLYKNRRNKILLIAHSMGSIIAYHVLTEILPSVQVDTFVTIGSPLGLPVIKSKIVAERRTKSSERFQLKTPENIISNWYNLADLKDKIAIDYNLSDDYGKNSRNVGVTDIIVNNRYKYRNNKNHHKSYGYLSTVEMAKIICNFIKSDRKGLFGWFKDILRI
ncbi:MAG: hypothetical protein JXL81_11605 [Deltaproteobacteria bacterium]|nr:hypothetical protein [Deltaproteobacteria bacterium]